jgi:hypothetical protein
MEDGSVTKEERDADKRRRRFQQLEAEYEGAMASYIESIDAKYLKKAEALIGAMRKVLNLPRRGRAK